MTERTRQTRAEKQAETRARLMTAAREVFAEKGVAGGSVEEICERAGFTRGAFYSNYESKDALCLAIMQANEDATFGMLAEAIERPLDDRADAVQTMLAVFLAQLPLGSADLLLHQELALQAQRDPTFRPMFAEFLDHTHTQTGAILTRALAIGPLRLTTSLTTAIRLLEGEFVRAQRDALIYEDADHGQARMAEALTELVDLITEPA